MSELRALHRAADGELADEGGIAPLPENARTGHRHGVRWGLHDIVQHKPAWLVIGLILLISLLMVVVAVLAQKAPVP